MIDNQFLRDFEYRHPEFFPVGYPDQKKVEYFWKVSLQKDGEWLRGYF